MTLSQKADPQLLRDRAILPDASNGTLSGFFAAFLCSYGAVVIPTDALMAENFFGIEYATLYAKLKISQKRIEDFFIFMPIGTISNEELTQIIKHCYAGSCVVYDEKWHSITVMDIKSKKELLIMFTNTQRGKGSIIRISIIEQFG
jgi:hypothetical protein